MTEEIARGLPPELLGDGILAFSLYLAGAEMEETMWCVHYYTFDILRAHGYRGIPPKEAANLAVKAGKRGVVRFLFKPLDGRLVQWFHAEEVHLERAQGSARDVVKDLLIDYKNGVRGYEETVMRLACVILKMRNKFMNGWKEQVPMIRIDNDGEARRVGGSDGSEIFEYGGTKFMSVDASKETQEHLGL